MNRLIVVALGLICAVDGCNAAAADTCTYRRSSPTTLAAGSRLVSRDNWLSAEHLRIGLQAPQRFMPGVLIHGSSARTMSPSRSLSPIDLDRWMAVDPDDGHEKSLHFLLDTRLYFDGIIVRKGDQVALESYRNGFSPGAPHLLLQATRPLLTAMLASAADRGRLSRDKSVVRVMPELAKQSSLRKTSVQRLLDGRSGLTWTADDRRQWLYASGWGTDGISSSGIRAWLKNRKAWPRDADLPVSEIGGPEGELLVWALESASKQPVSHVLCESVLNTIGAQDDAFWATDAAGTELADGLALSLRDLSRFGMALVDARGKAESSSLVPRWFAESLASAVNRKDPTPEVLQGLGDDAAWRYRFVSLGRSHQAAIVGPYGNSLFMDFDRKLVVAIYASFPSSYSPLMLQSLRSVWTAIEAATNSASADR